MQTPSKLRPLDTEQQAMTSHDELTILGYNSYHPSNLEVDGSGKDPKHTQDMDAASSISSFFDSPHFEAFYLENSMSSLAMQKLDVWQPEFIPLSSALDEVDIVSCLDQAQKEINWNRSPGMSTTNSDGMYGADEAEFATHYNFEGSSETPDNVSMLDQQEAQWQAPAWPDFNEMSVEQILNRQMTVEEAVHVGLIERLMLDRKGSKALQDLIRGRQSPLSCGDFTQEEVISLLLFHLIDIKMDLAMTSQHMYGNYLIQSFFELGNDNHRSIMLDYFVYGSVGWLSSCKFGCRVVQKILTCLQDPELLGNLVGCFAEQYADNLRDCLSCNNCHHVVKAILKIGLPLEQVAFLQNELNSNLVEYCEHVAACRVVQTFMDNYDDALDIMRLLDNDEHIRLCYLKYGNYVIQHIIQQGQPFSDLKSVTQFRNRVVNDVFARRNLLDISQNKYGSNVIETCVRVATTSQLDKIVDSTLSRRAFILKQLIDHRFGNYVPSTLLKHCTPKQQQRIVVAVDRHIEMLGRPLRRPTNGRNSNSTRFRSDCRQIFLSTYRQ